MELRQIAANKPAQKTHQVIDLNRRPFPILGRKAEKREIADPEIHGSPDAFARTFDAATVAFHAR
jgi:hypothetical protein